MFIKSIQELPESGSVSVVIANEYGSGEECFVLSVGEWKRMCKALLFVPKELEQVTETLYDALRSASERTSALREAARILSMGDKSAKEIRRKLIIKGHSNEAADHAVTFLVSKGYLNEADSCIRIAESAVRTKHYGRRRIVEYLRAHGYETEAANAAADSVPDEDYREALRYQIEKKYPDAGEMDYKARQKAVAALMRQGFSAGEIIEEIKNRSI